jgi:putative glycosyltransferase
VQHREREVYLGGLYVITGFDQRARVVHKHSRGQSTYTFRKKVIEAVNAITAFSNKPLILIFYVGTAMMALTGPYLGYLIIRRLLLHVEVEGWTSLIVSVWFLGGLNLFMLGIIGIYLSKVFIETKNRPYTLIRQIYEHHADERSAEKESRHPEASSTVWPIRAPAPPSRPLVPEYGERA